MNDKPQQGEAPGSSRVSTRTVLATVIGVVALLFILLNRNHTEVSFIFFRASAPLWLALALVAGAGFGAGFLFAKRRGKG